MFRQLFFICSLTLCLQAAAAAAPAHASGGPELRAAWLAQSHEGEEAALLQESVLAFIDHFNLLNSLATPPPWPGLALEPAESGGAWPTGRAPWPSERTSP